MGKKKSIFMGSGISYNTLIGGEGINTATAEALETLLELSAGDVQNFNLDGNDIECNIFVTYDIPAAGFYLNTDITTFIDIDGNVNTLQYRSFRGCTALTDIEFPRSTITTIASEGFQDCAALTSCLIPNSIHIGNTTFSNCTLLTEFVATGVLKIDLNAFLNCTSLTVANYPNCVELEGSAFQSCINLATTDFTSVSIIASLVFRFITTVQTITMPALVNTTLNSFYQFYGLTELIAVNLETAAQQAFFSCTGMVTANFPKLRGTIGVSAFNGCTALVTMNVDSANITRINRTAFNNCQLMTTDIDWVNCVGVLDNDTFRDCRDMTSIKLNGITGVTGNLVFYTCSDLVTLELSGVTSIPGNQCFGLTASLATFSLPELVNAGGSNVFYQMTGLETFATPKLQTIGPTTGNDIVWFASATGWDWDANVFLETSDGGGVEGDVQDAIDNFSVNVTYI